MKTSCWYHVHCRIDVGEFKDMSKDEFLSKYNFLVQRLSLLLLQVCGHTGCTHAHLLGPSVPTPMMQQATQLT
jgi:hypothetical protein